MSILKAAILGLIQGIAEFLPISSSGHLVLFQNLLGMTSAEENILFDILLHFGTLISVAVFYWQDIWEMIKAFFGLIGDLFKGKFDINKKPASRFIGLLFVATLPLFVAVIFNDKVEEVFSSTLFVGCALLVTGVILFIVDRIPKGTTDESNTKYKNAFVVGLFQLFAIFPGISRSGSTIFGGTLVGMSKKFAVKFSLLMSLIAILGAVATSVPDISGGALSSVSLSACIVGMAVAAISGFFAIKFLVNMLNKGKFRYFSYYCWTVGIIAIIFSIIK